MSVEPLIRCDRCEDRGWVIADDGGAGTASRCECNPGPTGAGLLLAGCGVPEEYADCSWSTWRGERPAEAERFAAEPEGALFIHGLQGRGKTHLATAVFRAVIESARDADTLPSEVSAALRRIGGGASARDRDTRRPGVWRDVPALCKKLRGLVGSNAEDHAFDAEIRRCETAGLLLLDDAHLCRTPFDIEVIDGLIRARHAFRRPMIVTSNCSLRALVSPPRDPRGGESGMGRDPATASRLRGCEVQLTGPDWRAA